MLPPSAGTPPPPHPASLSSPTPTSCFLPSLPLLHRTRPRCLPIPKAAAFPPRPRPPAPPLSSNTNLSSPSNPPPPSSSTPSPSRPSSAFSVGPTEDPLVSKLRTQLGVIHPLPAPPPLPAISRSVLGLFALFFFVGAAFDKLLTIRRRRAAEREVRVNGTWPQVPTSGFSLFLEEKDLQRKESVEWVNMVLGKLWKVYRPGIENWIVGLLQPVIDNLQKPDYVNRVEIRQFYLGEEPLSVRNVERRTSRRANDLQYQIGIRYAGDARMALALSLKFSAVPIVVPVWVRDFDIDGELWVKLRLIPTEPWVGAASWAFVSLPKIKFELSLFRLFNLMAIPVLSIFLTKLLTEDLPRLFVRPKKIVLDFEKGRAMGPVAGDVTSDIIQNVASGIMQGVATELTQDGNKDFVGELSVTLVDARKLSFVLFGKTDPYVAMILGDQVIKSKKNSQTTVTGLPEEPIWNQDFHMLVTNPRKQKLCIQVKDSVGLTDITIGTGEVDLSSLKDTVPTDKIVTLYGGWGFFGKRSSGEVLLRLTYKAYVEDEEDEGVKTEYAAGYISDEDVLDYVRIDGGAKQQGDFSGNERETFMDLLAALLVSEEFQGIVSSAETRSSRDNEQVEQVKVGDSVEVGKTIVVDEGTMPSSSGSLGSSAGSNKRGSLVGGDDDGAAGSDQRVPMAFELDWQMAARSTKAKFDPNLTHHHQMPPPVLQASHLPFSPRHPQFASNGDPGTAGGLSLTVGGVSSGGGSSGHWPPHYHHLPQQQQQQHQQRLHGGWGNGAPGTSWPPPHPAAAPPSNAAAAAAAASSRFPPYVATQAQSWLQKNGFHSLARPT